MEIGKFGIEKLIGSNYTSWKLSVKMLLMREDLWQFVEEDIPSSQLREWKKGNEKALATIVLSLDKSQYSYVNKCNNAKDAWLLLQDHYENKTLVSKISMLKKICTKKFLDGSSMENHLLQFDELFSMAESMEIVFPEIFKIAFLLASMPDSYDNLVVALEARNEKDLTFHLVKQKLSDEFLKRTEKQGSASEEQLMYTRNIVKRPPRKCFICGEIGHIKYFCPKLKREFDRVPNAVTPLNQETNRANAASSLNHQEETFRRHDDSILLMTCGDAFEDAWYIDSGATKHMCREKAVFTNFVESHSNVTLANGSKTIELGKGDIQAWVSNSSDKAVSLTFQDALYVPGLSANLISVSKLVKNGFEVRFNSTGCYISNGKIDMQIGDVDGALFKLRKVADTSFMADSSLHKPNCQHQWHRKLGHRDLNCVSKIYNHSLCDGIRIDDCGIKEDCECCLEGKLTRLSFPKHSNSRSSNILDLVHTDLCGPVIPSTNAGKSYVMTMVDDYSRYTKIYLLSAKSDAKHCFKQYVAEMENKFEKRLKSYRSDRGGEYLNQWLDAFCQEKGITNQTTLPYTPQQNGVAERKNRYLIEMTRCLLIDAKLGKEFWGEAVMTAAYLQNRIPSDSVERTPYELWTGRKPNLQNLHIFGCKAWVHIPKCRRKKLDSTSVPMTFIGYPEGQKGYKFVDLESKKVVLSRDAKFLEFNVKTGGEFSNCIDFDANIEGVSEVASSHSDESVVALNESEHSGELQRDEYADGSDEESNLGSSSISTVEEDMNRGEPFLRRSARVNKGKLPVNLEDYYVGISKDGEIHDDPKTFKNAINSAHKCEWMTSMDAEMSAFSLNSVWTLVEPPKDCNVVGCKWIYKTKRDNAGNVVKYKSRLVAQGFSQKFGVDYDEVFAPVVKQSTFRMFLTKASKDNMFVHHVDVKTAFLNGELEENIYMKQPKGYINEDHPNHVYKLNKSIYGLKQAARSWFKKAREVLNSIGFQQSKEDECLYFLKNGNKITYLLIYVDDILIASESKDSILRIEEELASKLSITTLGEVKQFLGMEINRGEDGIFSINQKNYISNVSLKFGLKDAKGSKIPLSQDYLTSIDETEKLPNNEKYRSLVGSLLYIAVNSRPDISIAVSLLSQKIEMPSKRDWTEAKRVLRYLNESSGLSLHLGKLIENDELICYVDADWGGDCKDRKSNCGFVLIFGGSLIQWASRKQTSVSLSSTEAEYISLAEACQDIIWIKRLIAEFGYNQSNPIDVMEDNQSCIKLATSDRVGRRSKHIETKYHFIKDLQANKTINLVYCPTQEMIADCLTKPLGRIKINYFRNKLGIY